MSLRRRRTEPLPPQPGEATVRLAGVDAVHDRTVALRGVDLSIEAGSITAVIGPNGAGKSTLFSLISGRLRPSAGAVAVRGEVADVLQATGIDEQLRLTVDDVVRMGRYPRTGLLRRMRTEDREACDEAIERVGMTHLRRRPITELSGGERQRALVAQGLAQQADILLLDEPATGLDVASQRRILEVIAEEAASGAAVLFSTHQLADAHIADTVVALACSCVCCAPPAVALDDPKVTALFDRPELRTDRVEQTAA